MLAKCCLFKYTADTTLAFNLGWCLCPGVNCESNIYLREITVCIAAAASPAVHLLADVGLLYTAFFTAFILKKTKGFFCFILISVLTDEKRFINFKCHFFKNTSILKINTVHKQMYIV